MLLSLEIQNSKTIIGFKTYQNDPKSFLNSYNQKDKSKILLIQVN